MPRGDRRVAARRLRPDQRSDRTVGAHRRKDRVDSSPFGRCDSADLPNYHWEPRRASGPGVRPWSGADA
ncbi:MAG: hypothetical protein AVDCRST_MAG49-3562 [uncultured Thermomicrobiales bacterium]|uniref:Uncharacterized protein n=1 Tax=uncultured Thermomicrobiales bacterium TaxID=1645740 RepID=A0A6J4VB56_9BACT|nr:MAG: hypothetical protein AVDCRST_MAG49-3562 [uncultured Thermomicrobiales bacterium]